MEQYEDIKNELQQELQDLQHNVAQHSTFNREVWQRAVKRHSRNLYLQNLFSAIFIVIVLVASTLFQIWPWWILVPLDLIVGFIVVESLIASNDLRKADVQSREGLLSLRESMRVNRIYSKRKQIIIRIIASILLVIMFVYLYLHVRDAIVPVLVGFLASYFVGPWITKRIKKQHDDFVEEIDELLKE